MMRSSVYQVVSMMANTGCRRRVACNPAARGFDRLRSKVTSTKFLASPATGHQEASQQIETPKLIYKGSLGFSVKTLKRVSIGTCAISVVGIPALLFIGSDVPAAGQLAVGGTTLAATVGSTLLLNVCVSPYVLRMFEVPAGMDAGETAGRDESGPGASTNGIGRDSSGSSDASRRFRVERLSLLGGRVVTEFGLDEVEPLPTAIRPFVTFGAKNQLYYIEGHAIEDKGLLRRLLGRPLKAWEE